MKHVSLAIAALVVIAAACQEVATAPQASDIELREARLSNPPPPPIDTGASGSFSPDQPTFAIQQSPLLHASISTLGSAPSGPAYAVFQSPGFFSVPVTYFLNRELDEGYLHFSSDKENSVQSASNGMVRYKRGALSGMGTLEIQTSGGLLVIDLSSISGNSFGCGAPEVGAAAQPGPGNVCFSLTFDSATLYPPSGPPVEGSVDMQPGCPPDNESCFIFEG